MNRYEWFELCIAMMSGYLPNDYPDRDVRVKFSEISEHAAGILVLSKELSLEKINSRGTADISFLLGLGYEKLGMYEKSLAFYTQSKTRYDSILD